MPRNASGQYTLPSGNPVSPGTTIQAEWANSTLEDIATELTNSLSRTGAGGMLAPFRVADGNVSAPGLSFLNETNSGFYRSGTGEFRASVLGVYSAQFSTTGFTVPAGKTLAAQGNATVSGTFGVTGAGTFGSTLNVTGAITATGGVTGALTGNVTAASGTSTFNDVTINGSLDMVPGSSATITGLSTPVNSSDAANKGYVDTQVTNRLPTAGGTMTGAIAMSNNKVTGLGTPTTDQDAATKAYVDSVAQGIDAKASCRAATTGNISLSGAQTIDGVAVIAGDRVLVKDQSTAAQNGIYVAAAGAWARSTDADTWDELVSAFTFVEQGTTNGSNGFICTISAGGTLGSTPVTFAQFSGAGQIQAGTGMSKTGNTLNVNTASSSRIVVGADEIDLATTGVVAGTYRSVTVDQWGRATGGTNPTTLSGYGISDAYTTAQTDTLLNGKLNLTGGTMSGAIAMATYKITGLGDPTSAQDAATKNYIDTIFGSTTSAAASAAAAASSASAASTSASNASTSASNAATSLFNFRAQYIGPASSNPTVDGNGNAVTAGDLYYNTTANEMRVYDGANWLAAYIPATGYLALSGGTMTGNITFAGGQTFAGSAVSGNITGNAGNVTGTVAVGNGGTGATTAAGARTNLGLAIGTDVPSPTGTGASGTWGINVSGNAATATSATTAGSATTATTATNVSGGTASVTTLTASSTVTLSAGTAQNIPYLNASKQIAYNANFVLDTNGNLGVGTSAPKLRVQWSAASAQNSPTLGTAQGIAYLTNNDANYGLCIGNSATTGAAWFQAQRTDGTATAYDIVFNTAGGNVGIGVATPQAKFDLSGDYKEGVVTANTGTAYTINIANGTVQILTLTGNCTFTFPTLTAGESFMLLLRQDGTGSRTVTWPSAVRWPGGTAPTITATASRTDKFVFTCDGTRWYGSNAGQNYTA